MPSVAFTALIVLAMGMLAALPVSAVRAAEAFVVWGDPVDRMFQVPGESQREFTVRVMQRMRRFTRDTSYEASGSLCSDQEGRMGIMIFTWGAHLSAPDMAGCPIETPNKGDFVHTHPLPGFYTLTEQDAKSINRDRRFFKVSTATGLRISPYNARRFSPNDYKVGPGYLVSDEDVFYQSGKGTDRHVMRLPPLP